MQSKILSLLEIECLSSAHAARLYVQRYRYWRVPTLYLPPEICRYICICKWTSETAHFEGESKPLGKR